MRFPRKRYDDRSEHGQERVRYLASLWAEGKPWTNHEINHAHECWLVRGLCYDSERDCFKTLFGRSPNAIRTRLWKSMSAYVDADGRPTVWSAYLPEEWRTWRGGQPWIAREIALVGKALGDEGRAHGAATGEAIGLRLMRTPQEVERKIDELSRQGGRVLSAAGVSLFTDRGTPPTVDLGMRLRRAERACRRYEREFGRAGL